MRCRHRVRELERDMIRVGANLTWGFSRFYFWTIYYIIILILR